MNCPNGHLQPPGARFCAECGAAVAAPGPPDHTVLQPPGPPPWSVAASTPSAWGAPLPTAAGTRHTHWVPLLVAVVVVATMGLVALVVVVAAGDDGETSTTEKGRGEVSASTSPSEVAPTTEVLQPPTTGATTTAPTTGPPDLPATSPPTTRSVPPPSGTWIASLLSISSDDPELSSTVEWWVDPDAGVYWLASDDYASLAPGWVVIYMGPFDSSDAAIATCHELGHYDRNSCYAAPLSQNPADRDNRVFP